MLTQQEYHEARWIVEVGYAKNDGTWSHAEEVVVPYSYADEKQAIAIAIDRTVRALEGQAGVVSIFALGIHRS